jgi:hypothetical protein
VTLIETLQSIEPRLALAILIGFSILLYSFAANIAWVSRALRPGRLGRFTAWARTARLARGIGELARWVYYLVLPWTALMLGYATARTFGVWNVDWLERAPHFAILGVGAAIAFIWVWQPYARTEHPHAIDESGWNWARHIAEVIYQQAHWAFYRTGPIVWLGDIYWGSFFGLGLVLLEAGANPFVRANLRDITRADAPLWSSSIAIASTTLFIFTQNSWYCLALHLFLDSALRRVIGFPRGHAASE